MPAVVAGEPVPDLVAVVDCGTNSIRLLIAASGAAGSLVELERRVEIVRLSQGVDATGRLHPDALARTFAAMDGYAAAIAAAGVPATAVRFVATSATRDADNRDTFFAGVRQRLGVLPEVISGAREAELCYAGALSGLGTVAGSVLVMDIGGGSTELVVGEPTGRIAHAVSLDVGSVRLTERFLAGSPPTAADLSRAERFVSKRLAGVDLTGVGLLVGVAGTVTTLAVLCLGLPRYDRAQVHGARIPVARVREQYERLRSMSVNAIRALPGMHPQRADVITAGSLIAAQIGGRVGVDVLQVSECDLLDGVALEMLRRPRQ